MNESIAYKFLDVSQAADDSCSQAIDFVRFIKLRNVSLERYKTKMIPKNSFLFIPKYDFKNMIARFFHFISCS